MRNAVYLAVGFVFGAFFVAIFFNVKPVQSLDPESCPPGTLNGNLNAAVSAGGTDIGDAIYLLNHLFSDGPPPCNNTSGDGGGDRDCPGVETRAPVDVIKDYYVHLAKKDWAAVACDYAVDAHTINDLGICSGRTAIVSALQSRTAALGPQIIHETVVADKIARSLFTTNSGAFGISDGTETFVIKNGQIQYRTTHGKVEPR